MTEINKELAQIFHEMAAIYQFLNEENRFRVIAYQNASRALDSMQEDIRQYKDIKSLEALSGIGKSTAEKILEYIKTGKIKKYEVSKKKVPRDFVELLDVKGFGPESLKAIHKGLGINTKDKLVRALKDGTIADLKRFGPKKVENMLKGLEMHEEVEKRMLLWDALLIGENVVNQLKKLPEVKEIELAGSLRRRKETIGDIDILVSADPADHQKIMDHLVNLPNVEEVIAKGETKSSIRIKESHRQVDVRIISKNEWGAALQYFTGSKEHNVHIRKVAREKGLKLSEYGIFKMSDGKKVAGPTEEEVYAKLGMKWMPPEMREDNGEIELAQTGEIPKLVDFKDIQGDLQMHSKWSDGATTIEELAVYAKNSFPYDYIVLTDHSKSVRIAGGMDENQFLEQFKEIKSVNEKLGANFVKKGVEVDIDEHGNLDLEDWLLEKLDWVVASIHTKFNRDNTDRIIAACHHPLVHVIGHPTGRLIGIREAYTVDMERVINAAAETGTALEINAQPNRMDLSDHLAFLAREQGAKLVISTDSHHPGTLSFMRLGVYIARRAWCTKADILNTGDWKAIEKFKEQKRKKVLATA